MARIESGEIRPGDQLPPERELMDQYGVGRPAVREALQALERSGIVEISHGERARVVVPTADDLIRQIGSGARHLLSMQPDTLEHMKDARIFLEAGTARMAAALATPEDVALLQQRLDAQAASLAQLSEFVDRDMAFHREIARISGNPIFTAVVEAIFRWGSDYYQAMVRAPGAEQLTLAEHQRIVDAIAAHDGDAADAAMRAHLTRSNVMYQRIAQEQGLRGKT
ncbi:GntR family transcriptional regulator [Pseudorhodoferax sp. Leaf267]|nr:GntR family transcriptional regulator [Pseudorhodoferax sp. Leaf267]